MIEINIDRKGLVIKRTQNGNGIPEDKIKPLLQTLEKNEFALKILAERVDVLLDLFRKTAQSGNGVKIDKKILNGLENGKEEQPTSA